MLSKMNTMELLVAFFGLASATPLNLAESLDKRGQFKVEQVHGGTYARHGPSQMLKAYKKFGAPLPAHLDKLNRELAQGSVPATPGDAYDSLYVSKVTLGSTDVNLDFDTGSADLWVFSTLQPSSQTTGHKTYKPDQSKLKSGYSWKIQYGDGSGAAGKVYADKVVVGGVTATAQAVEAATSVSTEFTQDTATDGLLGLSFSKINTVSPQKQTTFFDTVKSQLGKPLFAADLKYHAAGSYDFGFIDTSKFTGQMTYTNVDSSQGFWGFTTDGYQVGSGSVKKTRSSGIADTGTTLLLIDDSVVKSYYAGVSGVKKDQDGYYNFPCNAALPDLTFVIAGSTHTIPGKYINYAPNNDNTCFGGVQSSSGIGINIFGDIFLKSQYVVFDASGPRLGFAQQ